MLQLPRVWDIEQSKGVGRVKGGKTGSAERRLGHISQRAPIVLVALQVLLLNHPFDGLLDHDGLGEEATGKLADDFVDEVGVLEDLPVLHYSDDARLFERRRG